MTYDKYSQLIFVTHTGMQRNTQITRCSRIEDQIIGYGFDSRDTNADYCKFRWKRQSQQYSLGIRRAERLEKIES